METRSRFSSKNVYIPLIAAALIFAGGFYFGMHPEIKLKPSTGGRNNNQVFAAVLMCLAVLWALLVVIKATRIIITANAVSLQSLFAKKVITKAQISSIDLLARTEGDFTSRSSRVSGATFILTDATKAFIPERYYTNFGELKDALRTNFNELVLPSGNAKPAAHFTNSNHSTEKFAGNLLLTFNTYYILGFALAVACIPFFAKSRASHNSAVIIGCLLLAVILFLLSGFQMNYFIVKDSHLVIKNHIWPWRNIVYDVTDIEQVIAERNAKVPNDLRINFKNNTHKSYGAGSLRNKMWKGLIDKFSAMGIPAACEV